jgi:lysozyme family protein
MSFKVGCHQEVSTFVWDVVSHVLSVEGGYINDVSDSGGETNYGITLAVSKEFSSYWNKYITKEGESWDGSMVTMPKGFAADIYTYKYFFKPKFNLIVDDKLAKELFDTGVNCGTLVPVKWLQELLNVFNNKESYYPDMVVDGYLGNTTFKALESFITVRGQKGLTVLYNALNCKQGAFYIDLATRREKDEKFVYGWFSNRVDFI